MLDEVKGLFARFGRREAATPVLAERARVVNPFHAVSIAEGPDACDAAKARAGMRYLSREAPRLPLAGCTNPDCRCRYQHHDDRRTYARRIADNRDALPAPPYMGPERRRRSSPGRRIRD
jgi:hypothetical protein